MTEVLAAEALDYFVSGQAKLIDVRSEGEFEKGSLPGSKNLPILNNQERHEVGLCYKTRGQEAAIELGHKLVSPSRDSRVRGWSQALQPAEIKLVTCWRGGLRSQIAGQWIRETGMSVATVKGGFRALRTELTQRLESLPEFLVVSGPTGSRKTKLIESLAEGALNLEGLANHRGSAFGYYIRGEQPSQVTFEHLLALSFIKNRRERLLIEDESYFIGRVHLPRNLKTKMSFSPVIRIKASVDERVEAIFDEYVSEPSEELKIAYLDALTRIKKKLGGLLHDTIAKKISEAFKTNNTDLHKEWIKDLLLGYYDQMYEYSFSLHKRETVFEGDWNACKQWIQNQSS